MANRRLEKVDIRKFKQFVTKNFAAETPLYNVLVSERDEITRADFAAKFEVWLKLVGLSLPNQQS